jgi:peptide deformylase
MSVLNILTLPNPILRKKSQDVKTVNDEVKKLASDMIDTMYESGGIGLSAVQVGVLKNIIVIDIIQEKDKNGNFKPENQYVMINPKVVFASEEISTYNEGCLSVPGENIEIKRPANITVEFLDIEGKPNKLEASGLFATCIQHEIDHTKGVVISSYLSLLKEEMLIRRILKRTKTKHPSGD